MFGYIADELHPFLKLSKPVLVNPLTRLPCLMEYAELQFADTETMGKFKFGWCVQFVVLLWFATNIQYISFVFDDFGNVDWKHLTCD